MWHEPMSLAQAISEETGLLFEIGTGVDGDGQRWYRLWPEGLLTDHTFAIRITIGWRRLAISFEPGKFAGELLLAMCNADSTGRSVFRAILIDCIKKGAHINLRINGQLHGVDDDEIWDECWSRFELSLGKGQLDLGSEDGEPDGDIVCRWGSRFAAAVVSLLPLEPETEAATIGVTGFPEGAVTIAKVNRYERDRRNRAAAISIHGSSCAACGIDMGQRYGKAAMGYIEIHHTTPVSQLGPDYVIDPAKELVPLCPNCHAVAHRRDPPYSVEEIRAFYGSRE